MSYALPHGIDFEAQRCGSRLSAAMVALLGLARARSGLLGSHLPTVSLGRRVAGWGANLPATVPPRYCCLQVITHPPEPMTTMGVPYTGEIDIESMMNSGSDDPVYDPFV